MIIIYFHSKDRSVYDGSLIKERMPISNKNFILCILFGIIAEYSGASPEALR